MDAGCVFSLAARPLDTPEDQFWGTEVQDAPLLREPVYIPHPGSPGTGLQNESQFLTLVAFLAIPTCHPQPLSVPCCLAPTVPLVGGGEGALLSRSLMVPTELSAEFLAWFHFRL